MAQYAVVSYDDRPDDDNEVEIMYVTDNFEYAEKLAFHYAKQRLPKPSFYGRTECRILHLFSFKTPILVGKKNKKKYKINSRNFTYDGLTFSSSVFILEEVKDEILF